MTQEQYEEIIFGIICYAGEARGFAFEALDEANDSNFDEADRLMKEADKQFLNAHKMQTDIIQREAGGEKFEVTVLFVHAQDHLMNAMTEKNLIEGMIKLHKKIAQLGGK
jgi:cellobiose PTS system EIIA component